MKEVVKLVLAYVYVMLCIYGFYFVQDRTPTDSTGAK